MARVFGVAQDWRTEAEKPAAPQPVVTPESVGPARAFRNVLVVDAPAPMKPAAQPKMSKMMRQRAARNAAAVADSAAPAAAAAAPVEQPAAVCLSYAQLGRASDIVERLEQQLRRAELDHAAWKVRAERMQAHKAATVYPQQRQQSPQRQQSRQSPRHPQSMQQRQQPPQPRQPRQLQQRVPPPPPLQQRRRPPPAPTPLSSIEVGHNFRHPSRFEATLQGTPVALVNDAKRVVITTRDGARILHSLSYFDIIRWDSSKNGDVFTIQSHSSAASRRTSTLELVMPGKAAVASASILERTKALAEEKGGMVASAPTFAQ